MACKTVYGVNVDDICDIVSYDHLMMQDLHGCSAQRFNYHQHQSRPCVQYMMNSCEVRLHGIHLRLEVSDGIRQEVIECYDVAKHADKQGSDVTLARVSFVAPRLPVLAYVQGR